MPPPGREVQAERPGTLFAYRVRCKPLLGRFTVRILWRQRYVAKDGQPMPRKKLTLSVEESAVRRARRYSKRHGTSVSELVSRFLGSLEDEPKATPPIVSRLRGVLPANASVEEYRRHIAAKHAR